MDFIERFERIRNMLHHGLADYYVEALRVEGQVHQVLAENAVSVCPRFRVLEVFGKHKVAFSQDLRQGAVGCRPYIL